jgi:aldehyde dehydrogenase (NAD+)
MAAHPEKQPAVRCWKAWITASRSANRGTSTSPLAARHFITTGWAQVMAAEFPGYRQIGVVGQIIPWNFPMLMLAWKVAPALAMGNTVVLKPAEFTSTTAVLFAEMCGEIGLPPGVFNLVLGDHKAGQALTVHPGVGKLAFTGSTEVGRILRKATAGTGKKLTLELGGKSPFVVFDDADLDSAVEGLVDAIWFNQGQVCCAGSRLLVQESVAARLHEKIRKRMARLVVGDSLDKSVDIGPWLTRASGTGAGQELGGGGRGQMAPQCVIRTKVVTIRRPC